MPIEPPAPCATRETPPALVVVPFLPSGPRPRRGHRCAISKGNATHSIAVALSEHLNIEVIMLVGRLFRHSMVGTGAATLEAIGRIRADLYFMGLCSVHPSAGLSTGDYDEAVIKRALCQASAETLVLVSSEKLATASPYSVVPLSEIAGLVVPADVPQALLAPYRGLNLQVHQAG